MYLICLQIWPPLALVANLATLLFEGPLTCWMSVFRGTLTCLDVMWSLFWPKLDLKIKIRPTSGRFGENCLLKLVLVCLILTQWWNKKNDFTSPLSLVPFSHYTICSLHIYTQINICLSLVSFSQSGCLDVKHSI